MAATIVIRSLAHAACTGLDEADLLSAVGRDGAAFAELVRRHGPMVRGVCRRVLGPTADADDAFQLTFLALVEHIQDLRAPTALPGWLHRTAFRAAVKLKARRPAAAVVPEPEVDPDPLADLSWKEVRALLDEELDALPEPLRAPLVLCYLNGRTREDAAAALGVSPSTLKRRVADGLDRLNRRLTRRGVSGLGLAAAALGGAGGPGLTAQVPAALVRRLAAALGALPEGAAGASLRPAGRRAISSTVLLAGGMVAAAAALVAFGSPTAPQKAEAARKADAPPARADAFGDPLPDGAVLRLGSVLLRHAGVWYFALLPDGKSVLSAGSDHRLRTWDLATGRETRSVLVAGQVRGLGALSPDGRYAVGFAGRI